MFAIDLKCSSLFVLSFCTTHKESTHRYLSSRSCVNLIASVIVLANLACLGERLPGIMCDMRFCCVV